MATISFSLDVASIDSAIAELERYRTQFEANCHRLRQMIAERIRWNAQNGFNVAHGNDIIYGSWVNDNRVSVTVTEGDNVSVVIADGPEAIFIEFGAGVYHNGPAGDSPHPWGLEFGYGIGTYGKGKGTRNAWNITSGVVTRGTPADMPMYRGAEEAFRALGEMVREVFGE